MIKGRENKPHIAIYGACNTGKSTLLNFLTDAQVAIVSPHSGTTTDVVRKSYEIRDFAPVVFIDTAGLDDLSELGVQRVARSIETLSQTDLALLVYREWSECEEQFKELLDREKIPYIIIRNTFGDEVQSTLNETPHLCDQIAFDVLHGNDAERDMLLNRIKTALPEQSYTATKMFGRRVKSGDTVLLVCPIDSEAPSGRLILPQVQATRELLDLHAVAITVQPSQVEQVLEQGIVPSLVVTDSQVYAEVRKMLPAHIELTSFSILLAATKGDPELYAEGLRRIATLSAGDRVLISESCSHQVSCEDIGRVKIPRWLEAYCGCELRFTFVSGADPLPADLSDYALMVQCGGCMVTRRALQSRIRHAAALGVSVTNYGMLIKKLQTR